MENGSADLFLNFRENGRDLTGALRGSGCRAIGRWDDGCVSGKCDPSKMSTSSSGKERVGLGQQASLSGHLTPRAATWVNCLNGVKPLLTQTPSGVG